MATDTLYYSRSILNWILEREIFTKTSYDRQGCLILKEFFMFYVSFKDIRCHLIIMIIIFCKKFLEYRVRTQLLFTEVIYIELW
jgi:hypothetical protein